MQTAKEFIRAISHPLRKKMIQLIIDNPAITVTDVYVKLRLEQSVASQHLAILRRAGVLNSRKNGKLRHYYIAPDFFERRSYIDSFK